MTGVEQADPFSSKQFSAPKGNLVYKEFGGNDRNTLTLSFSTSKCE